MHHITEYLRPTHTNGIDLQVGKVEISEHSVEQLQELHQYSGCGCVRGWVGGWVWGGGGGGGRIVVSFLTRYSQAHSLWCERETTYIVLHLTSNEVRGRHYLVYVWGSHTHVYIHVGIVGLSLC